MGMFGRRNMAVSIVAILMIAGIGVAVRYMYIRNTASTTGMQVPAQGYSMNNAEDKESGLYFADKNDEYLNQERQMMPHPESPVEFAKIIIDRLIKGSQHGLNRTVPAETVLKAVYLTRDGTAYLDFSKEIGEKQPGGVQEEYMTVMSITNSLTSNIQDIKKVKFLIEGKDVQTLAGHVDLTEPFTGGRMLK